MLLRLAVVAAEAGWEPMLALVLGVAVADIVPFKNQFLLNREHNILPQLDLVALLEVEEHTEKTVENRRFLMFLRLEDLEALTAPI